MKFKFFLLLSIYILSSFSSHDVHDEWGFFGHRRINRLAVFTLPPEIGQFYKKNIDFITEHSVDPDKRRYASKHEAVRHYIDIDHWGELPFDNVPRSLSEAVLYFGELAIVSPIGDTSFFDNTLEKFEESDHRFASKADFKLKDNLISAYNRTLKSQYYHLSKTVEGNQVALFFDEYDESMIDKLIFVDKFSEFGILPYHLESYYYQLVKAFKFKDVSKILRISAEMGHYIGDGSVPLHTTENYNGQMTNQVGIHAFWESRIPELFADAEFDPISGKARYILEPKEFFWKLILESHSMVQDVLDIENELSKSYPNDLQFCFVERLGRTIRTQCEDYTKAYQDIMDGMVESRWHEAINSIGSVWYSAWLDAGSPDLLNSEELVLSEKQQKELKELELGYKRGSNLGRSHE